MEAQVLTHPTFTEENPAMRPMDIDPALQMVMPFQQFETLSVDSLGADPAAEALKRAKAVTLQSLAAEAINAEAIMQQYNFNVISAFQRGQAELHHRKDEEDKKERFAA